MHKVTIVDYQDRYKATLYKLKSFLGFKYWSFVDDWHGPFEVIHSAVSFWTTRHEIALSDLIVIDKTKTHA